MTIREIKELVSNKEAFKQYCEEQVARITKGYNTLICLDDKDREMIWGVGGEKNVYTIYPKDKFKIQYRLINGTYKFIYFHNGCEVCSDEFYKLLEFEAEDCTTQCGEGFYSGCMGSACLGCSFNPDDKY